MTHPLFLGLALTALGLFHLVPAIAWGWIPARWPFKPIRRSDNAQAYRIGVAASCATILAGIMIALWG